MSQAHPSAKDSKFLRNAVSSHTEGVRKLETYSPTPDSTIDLCVKRRKTVTGLGPTGKRLRTLCVAETTFTRKMEFISRARARVYIQFVEENVDFVLGVFVGGVQTSGGRRGFHVCTHRAEQ